MRLLPIAPASLDVPADTTVSILLLEQIPLALVLHLLLHVHRELEILTSIFASVYARDPRQSVSSPTDQIVLQVFFLLFLVCPPTFYSNTHNGVRNCVQLCPPGVINSVAAPNLYGDNQTMSCVPRCVSPLHFADPHTRLCQTVCSASANPPLYS